MPRARLVCMLLAVVTLLFPRDAFAYLDPGSGSLIFQTIVAMLAGIAYGVRVYWGRIVGLFSRRTPPDAAAPRGESDLTAKR